MALLSPSRAVTCCGHRGLTRFVNRAEDPHDSRRPLLERARSDGGSEAAARRRCRFAPALELRRSTRCPQQVTALDGEATDTGDSLRCE
jgi:hypothetical protein